MASRNFVIPSMPRNLFSINVRKERFLGLFALRHWQGLNALSKKFDDHVPDQSGNQGNRKVVDRENILDGE